VLVVVPLSQKVALVVIVKGYLELTSTDLLPKVGALKRNINRNIKPCGNGFRKVRDRPTRVSVIYLNTVVMLIAGGRPEDSQHEKPEKHAFTLSSRLLPMPLRKQVEI
jgi:hypothetical protein